MFTYFKIIPDIVFQPLTVSHLPLHLQIETTTVCNFNCITCPRADLIKRPKDMNLETFKIVYDQIKPRRINLSGLGEPLTHKDIFKISSYASKKGSIVNFPTNFTLARRSMSKFINSGISQLKVSIDAASRDTYFKIRGADRFEEIIETIQTLNYLKATAGVTKPEIRFNFALQKENIQELVEVINLASNLKVRTIYFQDLVHIGIEDKLPRIIGDFNIERLRKHLTVAETAATQKKIKTNLSIWLRDLELYANKMEHIESFRINSRRCYFPWFSSYIDVNGHVRPCPHVAFKPDEGVMGNIFDDKFENIWNNDVYRALRHKFKKRYRPFAACKTCIPKNIFDLIHITSKLLPKGSAIF